MLPILVFALQLFIQSHERRPPSAEMVQMLHQISSNSMQDCWFAFLRVSTVTVLGSMYTAAAFNVMSGVTPVDGGFSPPLQADLLFF